MNCTVCGCLFCWLCLQEISDVHFLRSAPGCGASGCVGGCCAGGAGAGPGLSWGCWDAGLGLGALPGAGGLGQGAERPC